MYGSMGDISARGHAETTHEVLSDEEPAHVETAHEIERRRLMNTFIPVVCSIFGVIIFMRLGKLVGTLGLFHTWLVIVIAFTITFLTVGSIAAMASCSHDDATDNEGLFRAVYRSVGGGSARVMCALFFVAFSVATAYYVLGFAEITMFYLKINPRDHMLPWHGKGSWVTVLLASSVLMALTGTYVAGARISQRGLRVVFVVVMLAVGCNVLFLLIPNSATGTGASRERLWANSVKSESHHVITSFATFFPAFCGVIAGANLADYLVNISVEATSMSDSMAHIMVPAMTSNRGPAEIVLGVYKALVFTGCMYVLLSVVLAACVDRTYLKQQQFVVQLVVDSILGIPVIYLGIAFTTLSSALSNIMGASGVLKLLAREKDPETTRLLTRETTKTKKRSAVWWAWLLSQVAILCGSVDAIIPLMSATFLAVFAFVNFTCFFLDISSPTFQPSFLMYSRWTAFVGFCMALGALFLIMSTFVIIMFLIATIGLLVYFQDSLFNIVGHIRRHSAKARLNTHGPSTYRLPTIPDSPGISTPVSPSKASSVVNSNDAMSQFERTKQIQLAALYVRDALHGRFLGEAYVLDGFDKIEFKRWYHALQYARSANMAVLLALAFVEVPSWCYFASSCGDPSSILVWQIPTLPRYASTTIELLNLSFIAVEMTLKYRYLGQRLYFADKWHMLQMLFLSADVVSVLLVAFVAQDDGKRRRSAEVTPMVLSPLIRPLLLLSMSERLRSGFSSLLRVLPRVMDGLLTLLVLIIIYAIGGMVLFEGTAEGRQYFGDFESAALNMLILLTTANFPDVMMPAYEQTRIASVFFMSFLVIGLLLMMNLVFASIYQNYRQDVSQRAIEYAKRRHRGLEFAFQLLPCDETYANDQQHQKTVSTDTFEDLVSELLRPALPLFSRAKETSLRDLRRSRRSQSSSGGEITFGMFMSKIKAFAVRQKSGAKPKTNKLSSERPVSETSQSNRDSREPVPESKTTRQLVQAIVLSVTSKRFDHLVDVLILGNLIAILLEIQAKIDGREVAYMDWEDRMPLFSIAYLVEMALKMYANGLSTYWKDAKNMYDGAVTIVILTAEVSIQVHYVEGMTWEWIRMLLLLRFLRCLRLLVALQSLSTMFNIVLRLLPAFTTLYGMLGIIMIEYAAIGVQLFGGKIIKNDPRLAKTVFATSNYYANNFNDFPSALTTLFEVLLVNNWNIIMEGVETVTSKWSRVYFISFYIIATVMMLNLVVAFVVEAYFEQAGTTTRSALGIQDSNKARPMNSPAISAQTTFTVTPPSPVELGHKGRHVHRPLHSPTTEPDGPAGQQLLRKRSLVLRPRGDSVYVEEFL